MRQLQRGFHILSIVPGPSVRLYVSKRIPKRVQYVHAFLIDQETASVEETLEGISQGRFKEYLNFEMCLQPTPRSIG